MDTKTLAGRIRHRAINADAPAPKTKDAKKTEPKPKKSKTPPPPPAAPENEPREDSVEGGVEE